MALQKIHRKAIMPKKIKLFIWRVCMLENQSIARIYATTAHANRENVKKIKSNSILTLFSLKNRNFPDCVICVICVSLYYYKTV
jgi:hypothetical protein